VPFCPYSSSSAIFVTTYRAAGGPAQGDPNELDQARIACARPTFKIIVSLHRCVQSGKSRMPTRVGANPLLHSKRISRYVSISRVDMAFSHPILP